MPPTLPSSARSHDSRESQTPLDPRTPGLRDSKQEPLRERRLRSLLDDFGSQLRRGEGPKEDSSPTRLRPSGLPRIDRLLGGGFPIGCLSEITGPASSGRTSLLLSALARTTRVGGLAALVDRADAFDPASAEAAGVVLDRVLWVRAPEWRSALRSIECLLKTEGFPLVVLDWASPSAPQPFASRPPAHPPLPPPWQAPRPGDPRPPAEGRSPEAKGRELLRRKGSKAREAIPRSALPHSALPRSAWLRLSRLVAGRDCALLLLSSERLAGSQAATALEMQPAVARFSEEPALLEALETHVVLARHRSGPGTRMARIRMKLEPGVDDETA
jgi:hypothetical protein